MADIIKKESFRSQSRKVNQGDDMYRVTVDMPRREYRKFEWAVKHHLNAEGCGGCNRWLDNPENCIYLNCLRNPRRKDLYEPQAPTGKGASNG